MRRLLSAEAALRAARAMRHHESGVVVYRVTGSADADYWSAPVLIAQAGDVPDLAPEPIPDDAAYFRIDCSSSGDIWTQVNPLGEERSEEAA